MRVRGASPELRLRCPNDNSPHASPPLSREPYRQLPEHTNHGKFEISIPNVRGKRKGGAESVGIDRPVFACCSPNTLGADPPPLDQPCSRPPRSQLSMEI